MGSRTKEAKMYRQRGAPFLEILNELVLDGRDRKGGRKIGREWEREVCAFIVTNRNKSRLRTQPCFQSVRTFSRSSTTCKVTLLGSMTMTTERMLSACGARCLDAGDRMRGEDTKDTQRACPQVSLS
jgi:hypothetical protein